MIYAHVTTRREMPERLIEQVDWPRGLSVPVPICKGMGAFKLKNGAG